VVAEGDAYAAGSGANVKIPWREVEHVSGAIAPEGDDRGEGDDGDSAHAAPPRL
jgi:hypothetical protein